MKVSELEGAELDYWVAKAEGYTIENAVHDEGCFTIYDSEGGRVGDLPKSNTYKGIIYGLYAPSTKWELSGPIIEREKIYVGPCVYAPEHTWQATKHKYVEGHYKGEFIATGPTPLIAAMRAYISSKYGETVDE